MAPIKIPPTLIPDLTITQGYSGGMAPYVEGWKSVLYLYIPTHIPELAEHTINNCTILN